ncbi:MAG: ectoine/hydroxyectoine ABC transporter substrate-binding protein EhuB [Firmicutes bacterium]|nr:ectoine/hydroxyectoine ABC transporter substrate-binding protein EhuB [Bacillota bacterium]
MKKLLTLLILSITMIAVVGCGAGDDSADSEMTTLEKAQQEGKIVVGFANEKPYAYKTADGEITGEAVEVARTVLKELGINEMEGVVTDFGALIPGLKAERFDIITAGMYITPPRAKEVNFGEPEYSIGEALAVQKGNPKDLHSYKDIAENPDATIAIMAGAIETDYVKAVGVSEDQIEVVSDIPSCISALQSGRVDATTMTNMTMQSAMETADSSNIEVVTDFTQPVIDGKSVKGYGAAAFRKADTDFLEAYNAELAKLKESGELLEIISEFGFTKDNLPGDVTTAELSQE